MSVATPARPGNAAGIPARERVLVSEVDAAQLLGVSRPTFRRFVRMGLIERVELPADTRRNLFRQGDLQAFADSLATTHVMRPKPGAAAS